MSKTNTITSQTVSFEQYAYNLGKLTAQLRENSLPFHNAYVKADAEQQRDLRVRWMCHHLMGQLNITHTRAEEIREAGKGGTATAAHKAAIDRAYSDFRYHVVRPIKGAKASDDQGKVVIPKEVLEHLRAIDALCATYPEMRQYCNAYIGKASK